MGHLAVRRRAAQRVERDLDGAVHLPAIGGVDALLQLRLLGEEGVHLLLAHLLGELHRDLVEAREVRLHLGEGLHHVLAHRQLGVEMRLLAQIADARALRRPGLAAELLVLPRHDPHQRGLAGAVRAQHADLGIGQEGEGDAFEHLSPARVGLGEVLHHIDVLIGGHGRSLRQSGGVAGVVTARSGRAKDGHAARAWGGIRKAYGPEAGRFHRASRRIGSPFAPRPWPGGKALPSTQCVDPRNPPSARTLRALDPGGAAAGQPASGSSRRRSWTSGGFGRLSR